MGARSLHKGARRELAAAATEIPARSTTAAAVAFSRGEALAAGELEALEGRGLVRRRRRSDGATAGPRLLTERGMVLVRRGQRPRSTTPATVDALAKRIPRGATLRRQRVQCGKGDCRSWHGPYWYAFWREGARMRSAYIGKDERMSAFLRQRGKLAGDVVDEAIEQREPRRRGAA